MNKILWLWCPLITSKPMVLLVSVSENVVIHSNSHQSVRLVGNWKSLTIFFRTTGMNETKL